MCMRQNLLNSPLVFQVYHPNIDLEGKICLNILREDWKPVLSISSIVYGLQFLFLVRTGVSLGCAILELTAAL